MSSVAGLTTNEQTPLITTTAPAVRSKTADRTREEVTRDTVEDVPLLTRSASLARDKKRRSQRSKNWQSWRTKARYYVPCLDWLPSYDATTFAGDFTSALTMTSLIVPQSMSYATSLAGLPPVHGLFGAAIPPIIYSLFGTCKTISVAPEAALSLIIGQAITKIVAEESHAHGPFSDAHKLKLALTIASIITFEAGLITFALGLLRLGFLDAVLSRALLRGFISAVALVILVAQAIPMLGLEVALAALPVPIDNTPDKFAWILENLQNAHALTAILSSVALLLLIFARTIKARLMKRKYLRFLAYLPEVLVVVLGATLLAGQFRWDLQGLQVLGDVTAGAVDVVLPFTHSARGYLRTCLGTSTVIAILGFLDSIVAAKDSASRFNYPISPNRELVALGAANLVTSVVHGTIPGYGSITRTRLAGNTGARTQMTSLLTGCFVLLVTAFALPLLFFLPKCILAAIVCVVVFSILSETPHEVMFFWKMGAWIDLGLMCLTFLLTLLLNVETGIVVSVALSMVLCIRQSASMRIKILGRVPGTREYAPLLEEDDDDRLGSGEEEIAGVLIVRIRDVALTFANAGALKERLRRLERYGTGDHHPSEAPIHAEASVVIFDLADVEDIDASACQLMLEAVESYVVRSVLIYWAAVNPAVQEELRKAGVLELSGDASHVQPTVAFAINAMNVAVLQYAGV